MARGEALAGSLTFESRIEAVDARMAEPETSFADRMLARAPYLLGLASAARLARSS